MTPDDYKRQAAEKAITYVEPRMRLGLGTGTTARYFVDLLSARIRSGLDVVCVPTSEATRQQAQSLGIPLTTLDETPSLDLTVDGADELDRQLQLIKGGGGALLREKIVACASNRMLVIADASKLVGRLGAFPLPIEVVRFGLAATRSMIELVTSEIGCEGELRLRTTRDGATFATDNGNVILDCHFGRIDEPDLLDEALKTVPGVVEHGLFLGIADVAIVAGADGITLIEAD